MYGRPICAPCAGILIQAGIRRAVAELPCDETEAKPVSAASQFDWDKSGRVAIEMFKEAGVKFERVNSKTAVEEIFSGLIKWADHEGKGFEQIACKLRDVRALVPPPLFEPQS